MGSHLFAKDLKQKHIDVRAMLSLETMGYYTDTPHSQSYPYPLRLLYPSRGNFLAFVGNLHSASLVREAIGVFRKHAHIPSEGAALPAYIPGVDWSDHLSFWEHGFPAIMITDTAPNRYPYYHTSQDTEEKINFEQFSAAVEGLCEVVLHLLTTKKEKVL